MLERGSGIIQSGMASDAGSIDRKVPIFVVPDQEWREYRLVLIALNKLTSHYLGAAVLLLPMTFSFQVMALFTMGGSPFIVMGTSRRFTSPR